MVISRSGLVLCWLPVIITFLLPFPTKTFVVFSKSRVFVDYMRNHAALVFIVSQLLCRCAARDSRIKRLIISDFRNTG